MKINTSLALRQALVLEEDVQLADVNLSANVSLKAIDKLHVKSLTTLQGNLFRVDVTVHAVLTLECAYTLAWFDQALDFEDTIFFSTTHDEDGEDVFFEKGPIINLDEYIFGLILAHIPLRVVKPGATLPSGGESFDVQTEDEFYQARTTTNNPFADLDLSDFEE